MQQIAISSWSLNTFFRSGQMDWKSFCATVRGFGLRHVELNNHFFTSLDDDYINDLAETLKAYEIEVVNLAIDDNLGFAYANEAEEAKWKEFGHIGGGLAHENEDLRAYRIDRIKKWIDIGSVLGTPNVRDNTGGDIKNPDEASIKRCADSFQQLCDYAKSKGMNMIIENHGGISGNIDALDQVFALVDRDNLGQALDFGNWPAEKRYESVERSASAGRAMLIHPKTHAFNDLGEQPEWDTYRMAHEVMRSGFQGPWVIEYESDAQDRFHGIQLSINMIKRCFAA